MGLFICEKVSVFLYKFLPHLMRQVIFLNLELMFDLGVLTNKAGVTDMQHHTWLFMCVLTSQT